MSNNSNLSRFGEIITILTGIGGILSGFYVFVIGFSPGTSQDLKREFFYHIARQFWLEAFVLLFVSLLLFAVYRFTLNGNGKVHLSTLFTIILVSVIGLNIYWGYHFLKARYFFINNLLYISFKCSIDRKVCAKVNEGDYEGASDLYSRLLKSFPVDSRGSYAVYQVRELNSRIERANEYQTLGNGVFDKTNNSVSRTKFADLLLSYSLYPQENKRNDIIRVINVLDSGIVNASIFFRMLKSGQLTDAEKIYNQWGWLFISNGILENKMYGMSKSRSHLRFQRAIELISTIEDETAFTQRIKAAWMLDNASNIINWQRKVRYD
ncbi:MAG: hypothetical protein JSS76_00665 [Bacteroidetes bacterium]|nr:hypothetical protein [Bacteroidota bacterium]